MPAEARVCHGENPRVFEATGPTPAAALRAMADLLENIGVDHWLSARVDYYDRNFELTIID